MARELRSKMGYLLKSEIQDRIDNSKLDKYDYVFAKDTNELFIIDEELNIRPTRYQFDVFENQTIADVQINTTPTTYAGEIVMVQTEEDGIKPYVVNYDEINERYYTLPANSGHISAIVDYNTVENTPIKNIQADTEILLSELTDGYYMVKGMYRICDSDGTHRMTGTPVLFSVLHEVIDSKNCVFITEFNSRRIKLYTVIDNVHEEDSYVLTSQLGDQIREIVEEEMDDHIEEYINDHFATDEDINDLFGN